MCQFYLKKEKRKCKKADPFCHHHKPKVEHKEMKSKKVESCMICCEEKVLYPTTCCSFNMCKSCILENGKDCCPHCKRKVSNEMSFETRTTFDIVVKKQKRIEELEKEVQNLTFIARRQDNQHQHFLSVIQNMRTIINI
jgi:hypothetical protein